MACYIQFSPSQPNGPTATCVTDYYEPLTPFMPNHTKEQHCLSQLTAVRISPTHEEQWLSSQYSMADDLDSNADLSVTAESRFDTDFRDSQPVLNQQFYHMLDDVLFNLPKDLYIEKLLQLTKNNDDNICVYRSILLKRAKTSNNCPNGDLRQRRTTSQGESRTRYAHDCYSLQHFITNNDPKILAGLFTNRKMSVRHGQTTIIPSSNCQQIELAELKTLILLKSCHKTYYK